MRKTLKRFASLFVNLLTVLFLIAAAWLVWRPGSYLRTKWENHRSRVMSLEAARQYWSQLATASIRLYDSDETPWVIEVLDYECEFCRQAAISVDSAVDQGARVAVLLVPRPSSPNGRGAATATLCALKLGRHIAMHRRLSRSADWQTDADWQSEARAIGVHDTLDFEACMTAEETRARLELQRTLAKKLGVSVIPTFLSRTSIIRGPTTAERLLALGAPE
jgi:protein-disulfide isomerase